MLPCQSNTESNGPLPTHIRSGYFTNTFKYNYDNNTYQQNKIKYYYTNAKS